MPVKTRTEPRPQQSPTDVPTSQLDSSADLEHVWHKVLETKRRSKKRRLKRTLLFVLAFQFTVAGVGAWWFGGGKYDVVPKRFGVVEPGRLYRSGQMSQDVVDNVLRRHQIQAIVRLNGNDDNDVDQQAEAQYAKRAGIISYQYPMCGDGTGTPEMIANAIHRIHRELKARRRVLVHCHAGSNRTGVVIGYYRLLLQGWSPEDVRAEMLHYEFDPNRNPETIPFFNENARAVADLLFKMKVLKKRVESVPRLEP